MDEDKSAVSRQRNPEGGSEEIDLLELCAGIWRRRLLIVLCAFIGLAFGVAYAFLAPQVYRAEVRLYPPSTASLAELASVAAVSPERAFALTNQYLRSTTVKRRLLNHPEVGELIDARYPDASENTRLEHLREAMKAVLPDARKGVEFTNVVFEWSDGDHAAQLANTWVALALSLSQAELLEDVLVEQSRQIDSIDNRIVAKKSLALYQIENELLQLQDAFIIAKKNNFIEPVSLTTENLVAHNGKLSNVMVLRSLYLLGSRALSAEIEVLERRKRDPEAYIAELVLLKEEKTALEGIVPNPDKVVAANVDVAATPPEKAYRPRKMLVMAASLIFGGLAGLLFVMVGALIRVCPAKQ